VPPDPPDPGPCEEGGEDGAEEPGEPPAGPEADGPNAEIWPFRFGVAIVSPGTTSRTNGRTRASIRPSATFENGERRRGTNRPSGVERMASIANVARMKRAREDRRPRASSVPVRRRLPA